MIARDLADVLRTAETREEKERISYLLFNRLTATFSEEKARDLVLELMKPYWND